MQQYIKREIGKTLQVMQAVHDDPALLRQVELIAERCTATLRAGNKILLAGMGAALQTPSIWRQSWLAVFVMTVQGWLRSP